MSVRLYFGNLPRSLEREEFEAIFTEDADSLVSVKLISDRKTGKCRGFGFVTAKDDATADTLVEKYNGFTLQDATLKVEKAMPRTEKESEGSRGDSSGQRRQKKGGSKRGGNNVVVAESQSADAGPDPRWAQDLAKLKEMLAAQTAAS
ncbi:RNA-binding protein [cf. Phormidesmis sp. LEGE 11477]|uniref:RNA recognition motif domain-containing protein n=1 Tax=cf. Phormidesmis sp. LEGE 11477 TaxID=1828680 RepID=UPI00188010EF|nr:RNA-binding protein [cf. Phormidesmis sp. LEGE 11477]MBE9061459.1 RNA-binding protein [cf. Phormidesmis sp. LEGE 11477]